jgi:hypothetical protein
MHPMGENAVRCAAREFQAKLASSARLSGATSYQNLSKHL